MSRVPLVAGDNRVLTLDLGEDITGHTLAVILFDPREPLLRRIVKTTVDGVRVTDGANGIAEVTYVSADTAAWALATDVVCQLEVRKWDLTGRRRTSHVGAWAIRRQGIL